jgi:hypothetical protein
MLTLALDFLDRYNKYGDEFLNHTARVRRVEIWVLFFNVKTKEQSKKWIHTHSLIMPKNFKQMLSAR